MFRGSDHGNVAMVLLLLAAPVAHASGPETIRTTRVGFGRHAPRPDTSSVDIFFTTEPVILLSGRRIDGGMALEKLKKIGRVEFTRAYYRDLDRRIRDGKLTFTPSIRERFEGLDSLERVFIVARAMISARLASRNDPMTERRFRADSLATQREWFDDSSHVAVKLRHQVLQCMQEMEDARGAARRMGGEALLINDEDTPKANRPPTFENGVLMPGSDAPLTRGMQVFDAWVMVRK